MDIIDGIVDLARQMDPAFHESHPVFTLQSSESGKWTANVVYGHYRMSTAKECDSAGEALRDLSDGLIAHNRSIWARIRNALGRWSSKTPRLVTAPSGEPEQKEGA